MSKLKDLLADMSNPSVFAAVKRIAELEAMLEEALEYFEDREDVVDGEDGPEANTEMALATAIRLTLDGV